MKTLLILALSTIFVLHMISSPALAAGDEKRFDELGDVQWLRDEATAKERAAESKKPLLIFRTELPGCSDCKRFGNHQMGHPIVVDAATEFETLAIAYIGWPEIEFQTAAGAALGSKVKFSFSTGPLITGMVEALKKAGKTVPAYLEFAAKQHPVNSEKATFGMGCFWHGEGALGKIDGVLSTQVGDLKGEVVEVTFNPEVVSYEKLVREALKEKCASRIIARSDAQAATARLVLGTKDSVRVVRLDESIRSAKGGDCKHSLKGNAVLSRLPLTPLQATKLNAGSVNAEDILSPTQKLMRDALQKLSPERLNEIPVPDDYTDSNAATIAKRLRKLLE